MLLPGPNRADPFPPARCVPFDPFDRNELLDLNCDSGFDCLRSRGVTPPPFVGPWSPPAGAIRSDARRGGAVLLELVVPRRRFEPMGDAPPVRLLEVTGLEEEEKEDALRVSRRRRGTSRCELGEGGFDGDEGTGGESIQAWAMYPGRTCSGVGREPDARRSCVVVELVSSWFRPVEARTCGRDQLYATMISWRSVVEVRGEA